MKAKLFKYLLFLSVIMYSCTDSKKKVQTYDADIDIAATWEKFLEIISSEDKEKFKQISNPSIQCYLCLENTPAEQKELENKQNTDPNWQDELYKEDIFIPIYRFIEEDFDLLFSPKFVQNLKENKTTFHKREADGIEYYEILVTTTEPTSEHEGGQHHFQFIKIKGKWKLNEIGTFP